MLASKIELEPPAVLAAELALVEERHGGSLAAYRTALARARLGRVAARALLADELRREAIRSRFRPPPPSAVAVAAFHSTYAPLQARYVEVAQPVAWLAGGRRGLALETVAPRRIFSLGGGGFVRSLQERLEVRPLGLTTTLGALPLASARPAIVTALTRFARSATYESWLINEEERALRQAVCLGDDLPQAGAIALDQLLP